MVGDEKSAINALRIERKPQPERKSRAGAAVGVVLIAALIGWAVWYVAAPKGVVVQTSTVQEVMVSGNGSSRTLLNASGYVMPRREATVSSKVTGKVVEVLIEEGMKVEAGQVLARLDSSNVEANLNLAEAQILASRAQLAETKVRLDDARKEWGRVRELAERKIASTSELDRAEAESNSLAARMEKQKADVTVVERELAIWKQQMEDMVIRAPFTGIVTSKNAQPGEMISPVSAGGGFTRTGICTLVDMGSLEIEVEVNESYINRVSPGQIVEATLDSYSDWKIPAKVIAIIPTADRQKATVKVRVGFDKLDPRILPQMGVKVAFRESDPGPAAGTSASGARETRLVSIPKAALTSDAGRDVVWVAKSGKAERRAVQVERSEADRTLIKAGLMAGDRVVVAGGESLKDGSSIQERNP